MTQLANPFAIADPFGLGNPFGATPRPSRQSTTLTPEEEASLISSIGSTALSGLSYIGETLGKPNRALLGLLGGRPEALLNLIPFSDTLGITDPAQSVSGRDLLESAGVLGPNQEGFDFGDVLGFGAEVLLDPLTYLTLGSSAALGAGGRAAKAAGLLDDAARVASKAAGKHVGKRVSRLKLTPQQLIDESLKPDALGSLTRAFNKAKGTKAVPDEILNAPLGGVIGVGLPFRDPLFTLGKAGGFGEKIAGGLDVAGEAIRFSPPGRAVAGLFHSPSGGKFDKFGQQIAEKTHGGFPEADVLAKKAGSKAKDEFAEVSKAFDESFGSGILQGANEVPFPSDAPFGLGDIVQATDRGNFGRVVGAVEGGAEVFFRNPETSATATVPLKFGELKLAHKSGTTVAQEFAMGQVSKVLDDISKLTGELGGDFQKAFDEVLPGVAPIPGAKGMTFDQADKLSDELRRKVDAMPYGPDYEASLHKIMAFEKHYSNDLTDRVRVAISDLLGGQGNDPFGKEFFRTDDLAESAAFIARESFSISKEDALLNLGKFGDLHFSDKAGTTKKLAEQLARDWLNANGLSEGVFGPASGIPPGGQAELISRFDQLADDIYEVVIKELVEPSPDLAARATRTVFDPTPASEFAPTKVWQEFPDGNLLRGASDEEFSSAYRYEIKTDQATGKKYARVTGLPQTSTKDMVREASGQTAKSANRSAFEALGNRIATLSANMRAANDAMFEDVLSKGLSSKPLRVGAVSDAAQDFKQQPRYVDPRVIDKKTLIRRAVPTTFDSANARTVENARIPEFISNRLLSDPLTRGRGEAGAAKAWKHVRETYDEWLEDGFSAEEYGFEHFNEAGEALTGRDAHAAAIVDWTNRHKIGDQYTKAQLDNFIKYQTDIHRVSKSFDAIHSVVARNMSDGEGIGLELAFKTAGMESGPALAHLSKITGQSVEELAQKSVPAELVEAITGALRVNTEPEWRRLIGGKIKSFNRIWKDSVTLPFVAFFFRNHTSGQGVNMTSGLMQTPADIALYTKFYGGEWNRLRGKIDDPEILREFDLFGVFGGKQGGFQDTSTFSQGPGILPSSPFGLGQTRREAAQFVADEAGPLGIDRVFGGRAARRVFQTVIRTGAKANQNVEWMNRVPMYMYLTRGKGWDKLTAARKVTELHFDYSDLTPAEKALKNTLVPFYTFTRKMSELTFRTLAERPGGALAQTIRATGNLRGDDPGLIPEFISQGLSIPLGETPGGADRFITGFGLGHEDPLSFLGGGLGGAGLEALSRLNPLIKAPLEIATNQSFFQRGPGGGGRKLDALDPPAGRFAANLLGRDEPVKFGGLIEHTLSNSPLSRVLATAKGLTDLRPGRGILDSPGGALATGINLLTGVRITDVQPRTKEALLRDRIGRLLKQHPGAAEFTKVFVSQEAREKLPPEERAAVEQLMALNALLASKARARREAAKN